MKNNMSKLGDYPAEKEALFKTLKLQKKEELLNLLFKTYEIIESPQRRQIFKEYLDKIRGSAADQQLLSDVDDFYKKSLRGDFYAPFEINSKNYTHIPPETEEWFDRLGDLLVAAKEYSGLGEYQTSKKAFQKLYELVDLLGNDEIVFADEYGTWMIPIREGDCIKAYLKSLSETEEPKRFASVAEELLRRDKMESFTLGVYKSALEVAGKAHLQAFQEIITSKKLPTESKR